ncbi:cyclin-dependent protein kinase [Naviculisporaceae sp. PSN 640]
MLTQSSAHPSPSSPGPGFHHNFHYAPVPSPRQSPSRIPAALSRRQSASSLTAPRPSPSFSRPKRYVGVDAATQYSPMEPVDYATGAPLNRPPPPTATEIDVDRVAPPPTPGPKPMALPDETKPAPAQQPAKSAQQSSAPKQADKLQVAATAQPLSPTKRKNSQGPGSPSSSSGPSSAPADDATLAKRSRPEAAPDKALPKRYELCAVETMVVLIAHMLGELIETNDALALKSGHLTRFHSRTAPGISVLDYLHRLAKHATLTPPLLLSMVYYIDRLCSAYPEFTINTLTVHRFLITAATVAAKGLSDVFWNNSTYARVGGVRVAELKLLELEFLDRVDWKIVPNPEVLEAYYRGLVERCPGYVMETEDETRTTEEEEEEESNYTADTADDDDDEEDDIDDDDESPAGKKDPKTMRISTLLSAVVASTSVAAAAVEQTASVYLQPITAREIPPSLLAEIRYSIDSSSPSSQEESEDSSSASSSSQPEVISYEAPDLPEEAKLLRIGIYNPKSKQWVSSTSVVSAENFGKGYSPNFVLTVDERLEDGGVIGVSLRGIRIDAGQTRDFGPQAVVVKTGLAPQPELNKPVVLSPEGRKVEVVEKTFLQKYWWVLAIGAFVMMSGGGDGK